MSTPYAPPPDQHPEALPPNRAVPASGRILILWVFIIIAFVAFYQVFQPDNATHAAPRPPEPVGPAHPLWPLLIPPLMLAAVAGAFARLRARLPPKFRTGELRTIKPAQPEVSAGPLVPIEPIELKGRSPQHAVVLLRIDDDGFHWSSPARLLKPAHWLDVKWSELQGFTCNKAPSPGRSLIIWLSVIAVFFGWQLATVKQFDLVYLGIMAAMMAGIAAVAVVNSWRAAGSLVLWTPTHQLTFTSRELTTTRREQLVAAAKARRPELFPKTEAKPRNVLYVLLVQPFSVLGKLLQSDEAAREEYRRTAPNADAETIEATATQLKLHALWYGGMCGLLPLSTGCSLALLTGEAYEFAVGYVGGWMAGLILSARLVNFFARWSGMSLIKP